LSRSSSTDLHVRFWPVADIAHRFIDVRFEQWSDLASIGWVRLQM